MFISPTIMFSTEVSSFRLSATKALFICSRWLRSVQNNFRNYFSSISGAFYSFFPGFFMILFNMRRLVSKKFKIFYSIVSFISIYMMYSFFFLEFSPKVFFHNISMFQDSFSIYKNSHITKRGDTRFTFFEKSPVRRYVMIIFMSKKASPMFLANTSFCFFKNIFTIFNFTNLSFHKNKFNNYIINYNATGNICQETY
jgi:hypothetical protein